MSRLVVREWLKSVSLDRSTHRRWLGHQDGGVLAMKTYGHLRDEHSQRMAEKVKF
jgi:hypothetical protein